MYMYYSLIYIFRYIFLVCSCFCFVFYADDAKTPCFIRAKYSFHFMFFSFSFTGHRLVCHLYIHFFVVFLILNSDEKLIAAEGGSKYN